MRGVARFERSRRSENFRARDLFPGQLGFDVRLGRFQLRKAVDDLNAGKDDRELLGAGRSVEPALNPDCDPAAQRRLKRRRKALGGDLRSRLSEGGRKRRDERR